MDKELQKANYVRITEQGMRAYMYLVPPVESSPYSKESILDFLNEKGVVAGIIEKNIEEVLCGNEFHREVEIAKGVSPIHGRDGEYVFEFSKTIDRKYKYATDGSLNYRSISFVQHVYKNQIIARYYPPTEGIHGYDVGGNILYGKNGKSLSPLRGKGLVRSQDNLTYTAIVDGKIEFKNDRIYITNLYETPDNLDEWTGDIDFRGDVIIHGDVKSGITITATGSITVDGIVHSARLIAGKDIILRSGIKGGGEAYIESQGSIYTEFLEKAKVQAGNSIFTNKIFDSRVFAGNQIIITGENGSIIESRVRGVNGVTVGVIGEINYTFTKVSVGNSKLVYDRIKDLKNTIADAERELEEAEASNRKLEEENKKRPVPVENDPRQMLSLRIKMKNIGILAEARDELENLEDAIEKAKKAHIIVKKMVYPGSVVEIEEKEIEIKEVLGADEFKKIIKHPEQ